LADRVEQTACRSGKIEYREHSKVQSVTVTRSERVNDRGVVYAGTEPSAIFRSEDGGETWYECGDLTALPSASEWSFPPRPQTHHVRWIEPDPHVPGRLFVAVEAGALIRSLDSGTTWQDRAADGPRDSHQLSIQLSAPARLYSAAGDGYFESHARVLFKARDMLLAASGFAAGS